MNYKILYNIAIFFLGVCPAMFWFLLGSYWLFSLYNNIVDVALSALFYCCALLGVLGLWLELIAPYKYRRIITIAMCLGIITTCVIYFSEPMFFRGRALIVFSPVLAAIIILVKNANNKNVIKHQI
jgi:hypothetical protein